MNYWHELSLADWRAHERKGDRWLPWKQYIRAFKAAEFHYPSDAMSGRGIVIPAGGHYLPGAWVTVNLLRQTGCTLPVQIWHLGPDEVPAIYPELMAPMDVRFVDARAVAQAHPARRLGGWQLKPYCVICSPFDEVLLLDGDNHPARDPTFLFDSPEFLETGSLFWPDRVRHGPKSSLWDLFDVPYRDELAHETGQMLFDKRRCWKALQLAMHLNEYPDFHYQHSHGDTATFRFALHTLGQPFSIVPHHMVAVPVNRKVGDIETLKRETAQRFLIANRAAAQEYIDMPEWEDLAAVFLQMDPAGDVLFEHRSGGGGGRAAFRLGGENLFVSQFPQEQTCHDLIDELRGHVASLPFWDSIETAHGERISHKRRAGMKTLFRLAAERDAKTLIETGTLRMEGNWEGDGGMSWFLARYAARAGGRLATIDTDPNALDVARKTLGEDLARLTDFVESDSVTYLQSLSQDIDLLYLDSVDYIAAAPQKSQAHCLNEALAALPHLHDKSIICVDDCGFPGGGKGGMAVPYLCENGWKIVHQDYIVVLIRESEGRYA